MIYSGPNVYAHAYLDTSMGLIPNTAAYEASLKKMRDGKIKYLYDNCFYFPA